MNNHPIRVIGGGGSTASSQEHAKQKIAELVAKYQVEIVGFGAGSNAFLSGTAASHGHVKGDADLIVEGTNISLEVTGPLKPVAVDAPLWLRPDKIQNAKAKLGTNDTWVIHCIESKTIRVFRLDSPFIKRYERGVFPVVFPTIRGVRETYVAIPHDDPCVREFDVLVAEIKNWRGIRKNNE